MNSRPQKPQLPTSLKRKRILNIVIRSTICLLLLAIFITVIIIWGNRLFPTTQDHHLGYAGLRILFYVIVLCVPFLITGIPFKLIDTSWSGTIIDLKIEENLGTSSNPKYIYTHKKENLILIIKKDNEKIVRYTALSLADKYEQPNGSTPIGKIYYHEHKYSIGDRVHKYYGFRHLYFIPQHDYVTKDCIVCGSKNNMDNSVCWYCDSELI